jgi:hypothetical protein
MGFISSKQIGSLLFDTIQKEFSNYYDIVAFALKGYSSLTEQDIELIAQDLINATDSNKSSKENLINYFAYEAEHTQNIVKSYIVKANQGFNPALNPRI